MTTEIWKLPAKDRILLIERIKVEWPQQDEILAYIDETIEYSGQTAEPRCIALWAKYGMGKSTTLNLSQNRHQRQVLPEKTIVPALKVTVPARATVNNLLIAVLSALHDASPTSGTSGDKEYRLMKLLEKCGVKFLMFDEGNHLIDLMNAAIILDTTNIIKNIIKELNIACAIAGLPYTDEVLKANPQFGSLFQRFFTYEVFTYDDKFSSFMKGFEGLLPLQTRKFMENADILWRAYVATAGRTRYMVNLLKEAGKIAVKSSKEGLDKNILEEAFKAVLSGQRRGMMNPFVGDATPEFVELDDVYMPLRILDKERKKKIFK